MKKILLILALVFTVGAFACSDLPSDLGDKGVVGVFDVIEGDFSELGNVEIWDDDGFHYEFVDIPNQDIIIDDEDTTISDFLHECMGSSKNHGQYVSCIAHKTKALVKMGLMTNAQRTTILVWVAQSDLPY